LIEKVGKHFSKLLAIAVILFTGVTAQSQNSYTDLKKWVGKCPTYNEAGYPSSKSFFNLPEIAVPLKKLLSKEDFYYLTKGHTKESPIKLFENYLQVYLCGTRGSYPCDNNTILVVNLNDGSLHVVRDLFSDTPRYYSTKGHFTELPKKVQLPLHLTEK
jgi:hypothetical protein